MNGKQLKAVRVDAGMTQTEFAKAIGYSAPYVCNMENGHDEVSRRVEQTVRRVFFQQSPPKPSLAQREIVEGYTWFDLSVCFAAGAATMGVLMGVVL
jgi:transcriptional regulator with XRE-family HTH domain